MPLETLNDLTPGKPFPPERDSDVRSEFDKYYRLSLGERTTSAAERRFNLDSDTGFRLQDNIYGFMVDFWQDAVLTDKPEIAAANATEQTLVDLLAPSLHRAARVVIGDVVRYGVGVFANRAVGQCQAVDTRSWFPVRLPYDYSAPGRDALAWRYTTGREDRLVVEVFTDSAVLQSHYRLDGSVIGSRLGAELRNPAPADQSLGVVPVRGDDSGFWGRSDFRNAEQFVTEIHRRMSMVSEALDKHASPHLAMPETAIQLDEAGNAMISDGGMVIPVPMGANNPEYVVWNARFDSHATAIHRAFEAIFRNSRIAPVLVLHDRKVPQLASGAALRRLAIPTVARIKELRSNLETAMRRVLAGQAQMLGQALDVQALNFEWPPALASADEESEDERTSG